MNWKDIPAFTRPANYSADIPLDYIETWFDNKESKGLYKVVTEPDFQRHHVWTEYKQIKYIENLLRGLTSGRDIYWNHPNWMGSFQGNLELVDGLQRLTAVRRFMNNEIRAFGQLLNDFTGASPLMQITLKFHVNNLKTRKEVLQWYLDLNDGGVVHSKEEIDRVRDLLKAEG